MSARNSRARPEHPLVLIAQITDTHVTVAGRQARDLARIIGRLNTLHPRPDVILLSGDTVDAGRSDQYRSLRDLLEPSAIDVFIVPGNHDRRSMLLETLAPRHYPRVTPDAINYVLDDFPVRIIALDTTAPNRPGGILDPVRLVWLETQLSEQPERPALIFMHHPPFRTGVNMADLFGFAGARRFAAILACYPNVQRVICGHIHCERQTIVGETLVTTAISTTPQRVPELFERRLIGMRAEPSGFTLHAWQNAQFTSITYIAHASHFIER